MKAIAAADRTDAAMAALRVFAGFSMAIVHGASKIPIEDGFLRMVIRMGFPFPELSAWIAVISELLGGVLLALGLLTRSASSAIMATLLVAIFVYHSGHEYGHRERAVLHFAIAGFFLVAGPGRFSGRLFENPSSLTSPDSNGA